MEIVSVSTPGPGAGADPFTASLHAQRDRARRLLSAQQVRLEQAEAIVQRELQRLEDELAVERTEVAGLRTERDLLSVRLSHAEASSARLPKRGGSVAGDAADSGDYHRRYEMALDDLHVLKAQNAELQQQLAKVSAAAANLAAQEQASCGHLDWEAEKRRIFATLDADFDDSDPQRHAERLNIEDVLRSTQQIIAEKDRQIADLQRQLEEQRASQAAHEIDRSALDQAINADAVVQQERERLVQLQKEWQEKLRQAEIEISLERAKLARNRAELEEQFHQSEKKEAANSLPAPDPSGSGQRGHWLARLGLTEADRQRRRQL